MAPGRTPTITNENLAEILDLLVRRQIQEGYKVLDKLEPIAGELDLNDINTQKFVGRLAAWVDAGYRRDWFDPLLNRFTPGVVENLRVGPHACLMMARAIREALDGRCAAAVELLEPILNQISNKEMRIVARFILARCRRRMGQSIEARRDATDAYNEAHNCGYTEMAAVIRIMLAWLLLQEGKTREALRWLEESENILLKTSDTASLGSICECNGRLSRRKGAHELEIEFYECAVRKYRASGHRNLSRALAQLAFGKYLLSVKVEYEVELRSRAANSAAAEAEAFRKTFRNYQCLLETLDQEQSTKLVEGASLPVVKDFLEVLVHALVRRKTPFKARNEENDLVVKVNRLREEAGVHLEDAAKCCDVHHDRRGLMLVELMKGARHLANGPTEIDLAQACLTRAGELCDGADAIRNGRVAILECHIELARAEEEGDEMARVKHLHAALEAAERAAAFAQDTNYMRFKGKVALWRAICHARLKDFPEARQFRREAENLIKPAAHDYLRTDFARLDEILADFDSDVERVLKLLRDVYAGATNLPQATQEFQTIIVRAACEQAGGIDAAAVRLGVRRDNIRQYLTAAGGKDAA